ncbi:MAG: hypothetical protein EPN88_04105, partial [Bacteroidetes bacterium]
VIMQVACGQDKWSTLGKYLTKNGTPVYLSGVNYIVSDGWMINLPNLSVETMNADMAALQKIGINHIRFFPLWPLTQPAINKLDEKVMKQLDLLVESAGRHSITIQIAPITGWMSGLVFLPSWAEGDMFRDQKIIDGQTFLAKTIATRYRNNPAVMGYDFGNELNVLVSRTASKGSSPDQIFSWLKQIYPAFKTAAPNQLVTNGIGTGYDNNFDIRNIVQTVDYLAPHSYPYFHGTSSLDPWYGQRTTYSANFIISWCKMVGKPVVLQEIGCSEAWVPASKIGAYIRLNYLSTWADGAAGFLWWSSHNIDTAIQSKTRNLPKNPSNSGSPELNFDEVEYSLGLLTINNEEKDYAFTYGESIKTVNALGLSWTDDLPVCYIIVPGTVSFDAAMHKFITAYSLAKQSHFDVKLLYEGTQVPSDAEAVIIPGLKLADNAKNVIQTYLENGGKVYQSYENDFGTAIKVGSDTVINTPSLIVSNPVGLMEFSLPMNIPGQSSFRKISFRQPARRIVSFGGGNIRTNGGSQSNAVFLKQEIGKGTYYYLSCNLEADLAKLYNPWLNTNCELLYSALRPQVPIDIDNKYIELYIKRSGDKSIVMLLNHSEQYQNVTVKSINPLTLTNFETQEKIGNGKEISMTLRPAEVAIATIHY